MLLKIFPKVFHKVLLKIFLKKMSQIATVTDMPLMPVMTNPPKFEVPLSPPSSQTVTSSSTNLL